MIVYIETSAAAKLIVREPESQALAHFLNNAANYVLSSMLLETELRRVALRQGIDQQRATDVLDRMEIVDLDRAAFVYAGTIPGDDLRSLDALHIAAALGAGAEAMVSYDLRQIAAAEAVGISTFSPA